MDNEEFARFSDRQTLHYLRFYPVPVDRVWKAVMPELEEAAEGVDLTDDDDEEFTEADDLPIALDD